MTPTDGAAQTGRRPLLARARLQPWTALIGAVREWQPPLDRREFWGVQLLVLLIAGGHLALEAAGGETEGALSYVPTSLFLVPVVYAALNFGVHGALPTAVWSAVLTIPNLLLWHIGTDRFGELWQMGVVIAVAAFVGRRVDSEKRARREAEDRDQARRVSEEKYRGIFDHVAEPILVLRPDGNVENANEAAARLFSARSAQLIGRPVRQLIDIDLAGLTTGRNETRVVQSLAGAGNRPLWLQPVLIPLGDDAGEQSRIQLMLRNLTPEHERQEELEAYAQRMTQAREDERGRIARELHDGPVQSLVVLWRRLDAIGQLGDDEQETELRAAQRAVLEAADDLRRVSRNLRPSILDDLGLVSALRAEIAAFRERTGTLARLTSTGTERRMEPDRELALLRIVQEALRNIEQHAGATHAQVRLRYEPERLKLSITDDGLGIVQSAPSELIAASKLGLIGMREQARLIGAAISIGAGKSRGTTITLTLEG